MINDHRHVLVTSELHELEAAAAEVHMCNENDDGQLNMTLSMRSAVLVLAALGYFIESRKMYEAMRRSKEV